MREPRRQARGPRTDGARQLDTYLRDRRISLPTFCDEHGLDRLAVGRALAGDITRVSVDLAFAIQEATYGIVPAAAWRSASLRIG